MRDFVYLCLMLALAFIALIYWGSCSFEERYPISYAAKLAGNDTLSVKAIHSDSIYCADWALWQIWCEQSGKSDTVEFCGLLDQCFDGARGFPIQADTLYAPFNPKDYGLIRMPQERPNTRYARWMEPLSQWWIRHYIPELYDSLNVRPDSLGMVRFRYKGAIYQLWGFPQPRYDFGSTETPVGSGGKSEISDEEIATSDDSVEPDSSVDAPVEESESDLCFHDHVAGCPKHSHGCSELEIAHPCVDYSEANPCGVHREGSQTPCNP